MPASQTDYVAPLSQPLQLVAYPDWAQPEEVIYDDLLRLLSALAQHPQHQAVHLMVGVDGSIAPEAADLLLSDVMMTILANEAIELDGWLDVTLVSQQDPTSWQLARAQAQAYITLTYNNPGAIAALHHPQLPTFSIADLSMAALLPAPSPYKLHVGCGQIYFDGWLHIDADESLPKLDLVWDASQPLPFADQSCAVIYNEHFLEHLSVTQGLAFLRECYRLLQPDGVLRVAMPCLETLVKKYLSEDWREQDWLKWPAHQFIQTRAEMINIGFRWWGHQWLYDREELHRRLREAGFTTVRDVAWGESHHPDLHHRETRRDSLLICEAVK